MKMHSIPFLKHYRITTFTATFIILLLTITTLVPIYNKENLVEAATGTAATSTLTLNMLSSTAFVDLTVTSSSGTLATSASGNMASFSVATNNFTGYTLSISAGNDDGLLEDGNSNTLTSISSALSASAFNSSDYNGKWGYLPSKLNSSDNTNYLPSPTTTATTLNETTSANGTTTHTDAEDNYTIALGARADYTKPAGTYTNTFILSLIANPVTYSITYNKNATDTVTNMPYNSNNNVQSGDTSSTSITLSNLTPVRTNYTFLGWCSVSPTNNDTPSPSCSGTTYNPNGNGTNLTYGIDQTTANSTTIYAMWQKVCGSSYICYNANGGTEITTLADQSKSTAMTLPVPDYYRTGYGFLGWSPSSTAASNIASATIYGPNETIDTSNMGGTTLYAVWLKSSGNMQGWTGCSSLTAATYNSSTQKISYANNTFIALTDTRASNHGSTVGTSYQDTYAIARLTDGNCWMIESLRLGGSSSISLTTSNTQSAGTLTAAKNSFTIGSSAYTTQQTNATNTLTTDSARTANSRYLYGNYYSWAQAINTATAYSSYSASPQDLSICPSGWRLPLGGGPSQYGAFNLSYSILSVSQGGSNVAMDANSSPTGAVLSARFRAFPNNFTYSGYWSGSSAGNQGSSGVYWSTTAQNASIAYRLGLGSAYLQLGTSGYGKTYGSSVRCVQAPASTTLKVNYSATGIDAIIIKSDSPDGATIATVTSSGATLNNVISDKTYYLLPIYKVGYTLDALAKDSGATGTLSVGLYGYYAYTVAVTKANSVTVSAKSITNSGTMQNLDSSKCTANPTLVTDSRGGLATGHGNGVYTIQRLADGNCWMLNNLALGAGVSGINSSNTNNPSTAADSANGKVNFTTTPGNGTTGFDFYNRAQLNTASATKAYSYGYGNNRVGVYYNYCAASAGNYCYADEAGVDVSGTIRDTIGDLCPAGWQIPTGGTNSSAEYQSLYTAYSNDTTNFKNAFRASLSGSFYTSSADNQGTSGSFWSATFRSVGNTANPSTMYGLYVTASDVKPTAYASRNMGLSVRCILK